MISAPLDRRPACLPFHRLERSAGRQKWAMLCNSNARLIRKHPHSPPNSTRHPAIGLAFRMNEARVRQ